MNRGIGMPEPKCRLGYTRSQIEELTGDQRDEFYEYMNGQTMAICEGRQWNPTLNQYEDACEGIPHGIIVYPWDAERFLLGLPVID